MSSDFWEAVLRFAAVVVLLAYGFKYIGALPTVLFAISDFAWRTRNAPPHR